MISDKHTGGESSQADDAAEDEEPAQPFSDSAAESILNLDMPQEQTVEALTEVLQR